MTTTHTVRINSNPLLRNGRNVRATRVSKTRQYAACIVATATQKTVDDIAVGLADHEAKIESLTPVVQALLEQGGYESVQAFKAAHDAACKPWHQALYDEEGALREAAKAANRGNYRQLTHAEYAQAKTNLEARGLLNPWTGLMGSTYENVRHLEMAQFSANRIKEQSIVVGQQLVVSWHRDAGLAQKAMNSRDVGHYTARFYTVEIRTDIETVSK